MLIDDDPRYRTLLRHHISCAWPDVELVSYNPRVRGPLTPGVPRAGLQRRAARSRVERRLGSTGSSFHGREVSPVFSCPPSIRRCSGSAPRGVRGHRQDQDQAHQAQRRDSRAADEQAKAQSRWRMSAGAKMSPGLGRGSRVPAHRTHRQGSVSELFLAESARRRGGAQGHARHRRNRRRSVDGALPAGIQSCAKSSIPTSCASSISASPTITVRWSTLRAAICANACRELTAQVAGLCARSRLCIAGHSQVGIFHRDLKPGNVMLRDDDSIALITSGSTRGAQDGGHGQGLIFGTPHYEPGTGARRGNRRAQRSVSLGIMLFEMLTGKNPSTPTTTWRFSCITPRRRSRACRKAQPPYSRSSTRSWRRMSPAVPRMPTMPRSRSMRR